MRIWLVRARGRKVIFGDCVLEGKGPGERQESQD